MAICGRKLGEPRRRISIIRRSTSRTATRRPGEDDQPSRSVSGDADPRAGSKSENSTYFRRDGAPAYAPPRLLNSPGGSTKAHGTAITELAGPDVTGLEGQRFARLGPAPDNVDERLCGRTAKNLPYLVGHSACSVTEDVVSISSR